jgi:hypothetical protein
MRPCDCKDIHAVKTLLSEEGISVNNDGITVEPNVVILKEGSATLRIPMQRFKVYAEWYLSDQAPPS